MKEQVLKSRTKLQELKILRWKIMALQCLQLIQFKKTGIWNRARRIVIHAVDAAFRIASTTYIHVICADFQKVSVILIIMFYIN